MKIETDYAHIRSGVRQGHTIGSPISLWIENRDYSTGGGPDKRPWLETMSLDVVDHTPHPALPRGPTPATPIFRQRSSTATTMSATRWSAPAPAKAPPARRRRWRRPRALRRARLRLLQPRRADWRRGLPDRATDRLGGRRGLTRALRRPRLRRGDDRRDQRSQTRRRHARRESSKRASPACPSGSARMCSGTASSRAESARRSSA